MVLELHLHSDGNLTERNRPGQAIVIFHGREHATYSIYTGQREVLDLESIAKHHMYILEPSPTNKAADVQHSQLMQML